MDENQLKTRIFVLQAIDTLFVIALTIAAFFSVLYAENKEITLIMCLVGLFLVNTLGKMTNKKVAIMGVQLEALRRKTKLEEQRTLMNTRHRRTHVKKTTATSTSPAI